jgi:hypothetical protein
LVRRYLRCLPTHSIDTAFPRARETGKLTSAVVFELVSSVTTQAAFLLMSLRQASRARAVLSVARDLEKSWIGVVQ